MLLQLALDVTNIRLALGLAEETAPYVDILEAGTPLIKQEGLRAVAALREAFPEKQIAADMKTADAGALELRLAAEAGADLMSVLAVAPDETIISAVAEARRIGQIRIMADLLGVRDPEVRARRIATMGVDLLVVHCGLDQQAAGHDPFSTLRRLDELGIGRLAVAGGLTAANLHNVTSARNVDVVIVGGAITGAPHPRDAAAQIRFQLEQSRHG